jgi:hypothetical protein
VIDELEIALAPVFFGGGRRLFENLREPGPQFRFDSVLAGAAATHLRFVRQLMWPNPYADLSDWNREISTTAPGPKPKSTSPRKPTFPEFTQLGNVPNARPRTKIQKSGASIGAPGL